MKSFFSTWRPKNDLYYQVNKTLPDGFNLLAVKQTMRQTDFFRTNFSTFQQRIPTTTYSFVFCFFFILSLDRHTAHFTHTSSVLKLFFYNSLYIMIIHTFMWCGYGERDRAGLCTVPYIYKYNMVFFYNNNQVHETKNF